MSELISIGGSSLSIDGGDYDVESLWVQVGPCDPLTSQYGHPWITLLAHDQTLRHPALCLLTGASASAPGMIRKEGRQQRVFMDHDEDLRGFEDPMATTKL